MVSIVIVSHSAQLAEGVKELAEQMAQGLVAVAATGGIDDADNPIGTDPMKVLEAISDVYVDDGVVVLMDLGSALLSAEMALELLPAEQRENVYLCEAPLVEGAIAAVVQASVGAGVEQVMAEARGSLAAKIAHLQPGAAEVAQPAAEPVSPPEEAQTITIEVRNPLGLHARPAARFVSIANHYHSEIRITKGDGSANAKSINQVATLGVQQGDTIVISAAGPDAVEALAAIRALAENNFGDRGEAVALPQEASIPVRPETAAGELTGIPVSSGYAVGPVAQYRPKLPEVTVRTVEDTAAEWNRLLQAIDRAKEEIEELHQQTVARVGEEEAAIFEAHLLILQDPLLLDEAHTIMSGQQINAEAAWQQVIQKTADQYRALEDAYMRARALDVEDAGQRVLGHLDGFERPSMDFSSAVVLVAADLAPSDTAGIDPGRVLAICTESGGATSHSAILARALGIPAVVGLGKGLETLDEGTLIAVDGSEGRVFTRLDRSILEAFALKRSRWLLEQEEAKSTAKGAAMTRDGHRVEIAANIGGYHDAPVALEYGAEGVGLFRTEFYYLDREAPPGEEEQFEAYSHVADLLGDRPLIIRTLDVGGDKPLPYLDLGREENPFLGWRGIRFCLDHPEIFKPQLKAILRAGYGRNVKMMFPMVGTLEEVRAAHKILLEAREELTAAGQTFDEQMEVGIMIEVPSAVAVASQLAAEVDFFSIGTNDLTQYVMAADRGNTRVAKIASALQPAVLRMVRQTVEAGHAAGIWVGMCGELAGNSLATPLLLGLGLDELSMSAPAIPAVKQMVRALSLGRAREIAHQALQMESAAAVQAFLSKEDWS